MNNFTARSVTDPTLTVRPDGDMNDFACFVMTLWRMLDSLNQLDNFRSFFLFKIVFKMKWITGFSSLKLCSILWRSRWSQQHDIMQASGERMNERLFLEARIAILRDYFSTSISVFICEVYNFCGTKCISYIYSHTYIYSLLPFKQTIKIAGWNQALPYIISK